METLSWFLATFLSKGRIILYLTIITISIFVILYKKHGKGTRVSGCLWTLLTTIVLFVALVIFVATTNIAVNSIGRPSRVDVSSIAMLNEEQVVDFENTILHFIEQGILELRDTMEYAERDERSHAYNVRLAERPKYPYDFMIRRVTVFRNKEAAIHNVQPRINPPIRRNTHYRHIQNNNNTSALLVFPSMDVSPSGLYLPSDNRWILTEVQIGNVVIATAEVRPWHDLRTNYTTQFIEMLVEASMSEVEYDELDG